MSTDEKVAKSQHRVQELLRKGERVLATYRPPGRGVIAAPRVEPIEFSEWKTQSLNFLIGFLGSGHVYVTSFEAQVQSSRVADTKLGIGILKAVAEDLDNAHFQTEPVAAPPYKAGPLDSLEQLCERFHLVVRQLRARHNERPTLDVGDEYDVQDLLHRDGRTS